MDQRLSDQSLWTSDYQTNQVNNNYYYFFQYYCNSRTGSHHQTKQKQVNKQKTKELISSYNWQRATINNSQAPPLSTTATHT